MHNEFLIFVQSKGFVANKNGKQFTLIIENAITWGDEIFAQFWADSNLTERYIVVQNKSED